MSESVLWIESLNDEDRRTLVLAHAYAAARRSHGQLGYVVFPTLSPDVVQTPVFKQFRTVVRWLQEHGWKVTWGQSHWQGYVIFAFEFMAPQIPMPGQLKNKMLLRKYLRSSPANDRVQVGRYTSEQLEALYQKKLRPEIRNRGAILSALGLRLLGDTQRRTSSSPESD